MASPDTIETLKAEADRLQRKLRDERKKLNDADLFQIGAGSEKIPGQLQIRCRRDLRVHSGKVLDVDWALDKRKLVSSSQDGNVIVVDAFSNQKENTITLSHTWTNACAYSPSGMFIACGGLDNKCTIYPSQKVAGSNDGKQPTSRSSDSSSSKKNSSERREIAHHTNYISSCTFTHSDHQLLTSSGDTNCSLWDVESRTLLQTFRGHQSDVLDAALNPVQTGNLFVSGGCDKTACVWDMRIGKCVHSFHSNDSDINAVRWFPTGEAFATGSDDSTIRFFDLRADREVAVYQKPSVMFAVNDLDFSLSGRIIFAAYNDYLVHVWDTLKGTKLAAMFGHDNRVSCLRTSPDGTAFCTGSWDTHIRVWA